MKIDYDVNKVINFLTDVKHCVEATEFEKKESRLCDWCEFQNYCQNGIDYELIEREVTE